LSRWVDRIVCVSNHGVALAADEGIAPGKLGAIWNGIDTARFTATGPTTGGPAVVVARLSPGKTLRP
jgi:hypothetical protein